MPRFNLVTHVCSVCNLEFDCNPDYSGTKCGTCFDNAHRVDTDSMMGLSNRNGNSTTPKAQGVNFNQRYGDVFGSSIRMENTQQYRGRTP